MTPTQAPPDAPPNMKGDNITLAFHPDGRVLQHATLNGKARLGMTDEVGRRSITGSWIDLYTAPDGTTLTRLDAAIASRSICRATKDAPAGRSTPPTLAALGEEGKGCIRVGSTAAPTSMVTFVEEAEKGKPRRATSRTLVLGLDGSLEAISQADFTTQVRFESEQRWPRASWRPIAPPSQAWAPRCSCGSRAARP